MPRVPPRRTGGARALLSVAAATLVLAACGGADEVSGPDGVTIGEARALEKAADMLDEQRLLADPQSAEEAGEAAKPAEGEPRAPR